VHGERHVTGLRARNARTDTEYDIEADAVIVAVGQVPRSDLLIALVELDAHGYIRTRDDTTHTLVDGLFAADDLIGHRYRPAVTAAATGATAALDAQRWLNESDDPAAISSPE
jgi:thioredoxin reductase (NADPH)